MLQTDSRNVTLLGIVHFCVDFCCTALLTQAAVGLDGRTVMLCALLYNGAAFAFQLPIGALGDVFGLQKGLACAGCFLIAIGGLMHEPILLCLLIGLGNACFHIGGGREALKRGGTEAALVGKFVAPGAIGIFLGPRISVSGWQMPCMLLCGAALLLTRSDRLPNMYGGKPRMSRLRLFAVVACMFLTILLRSYIGTILKYDFMRTSWLSLLFALCVFLGKYHGGVLADRLGTLRFSFPAQILCVLLLSLSPIWPVLAFQGILLFNTTMAVTTSRLYVCAPGYPGTMFGLTTFALYLGVIPRLLKWNSRLFSIGGLLLLTGISAFLLWAGLALSENTEVSNDCDRA